MQNSSPSAFSIKTVPCGILLVGFAPVLMVLIPWDFGPDSTDYRAFMRTNLLSTTVIEFLFVFLAMARGFSPVSAIWSLPTIVKIGLSMLIVGIAWTTIFVAVFPIMAMIGVFKFLAHLLFGLAFWHLLTGWTVAQREMIWPAIGLGVIGFCLLWGVNIVFYNPIGDDWIRLVPTLTIIRWAGLYAFAIFCAGIGFLRIKLANRSDGLCFAFGMLFSSIGVAIAFWTGTRAALVAMFVTTALSALLLPIRRQILLLALVSTVIGLVVAAALPIPHPIYGIGRILLSVAPAIDGDDVSSGRVQIWIDMLDKISARPLMGWGIDQLRYSFPQGIPIIRHPHNGAMQLIYSSGLWGVFATVLIASQFVKRFPRKITDPYQFAAVAYILGMCAYALSDGPLYFTYPVMILLIAIACLVAPIPPLSASDKSN